ncbi:hypothetical protein ABKN59_004160 [Abortiporus biennis]
MLYRSSVSDKQSAFWQTWTCYESVSGFVFELAQGDASIKVCGTLFEVDQATVTLKREGCLPRTILWEGSRTTTPGKVVIWIPKSCIFGVYDILLIIGIVKLGIRVAFHGASERTAVSIYSRTVLLHIVVDVLTVSRAKVLGGLYIPNFAYVC